MEIWTVYLGYLWVVLIHCLFVGCTGYMLFGHFFHRKTPLIPLVLFTVILLFLEIYWMPIANYWQLEIIVHNEAIRHWFDMEPNSNVVTQLKPGGWHVIIWIAQGFLAYYWGKSAYQKMKNRD